MIGNVWASRWVTDSETSALSVCAPLDEAYSIALHEICRDQTRAGKHPIPKLAILNVRIPGLWRPSINHMVPLLAQCLQHPLRAVAAACRQFRLKLPEPCRPQEFGEPSEVRV